MTEFNVDVNKLNKHNIDFIAKKGFVYPSDEVITAMPEEDKDAKTVPMAFDLLRFRPPNSFEFRMG